MASAFVFINRKRTQLKVLYFEQGGYCLWSKRLEAGRFHFNAQGGDKQALSWTDLKLIVEGIDLASVRRFKRYHVVIRGLKQYNSSHASRDCTAKNAASTSDAAAVIQALQAEAPN